MTDHAPPDRPCRETSRPAGGAFLPVASDPSGAPVSLSSAGAPAPESRGVPTAQGGLLGWLDGRKTYLLALVGAGYVLGADQGWWPYDDLVLAILGFGGLGALRHGITKTR